MSGLDRWCEVLAGQLGWASVGGGVAVLVAWVVCRGVGRIPPGVKCWVWRVAILKLVIGLIWVGHVVLPVLPGKVAPVATAEEVAPVVAEDATLVAAAPVHVKVARVRDWGALSVVGVWLIGVAAMLLVYGVRWVRTRRMCAGCRPVECVELRDAYERVARRMGLKRAPRFLECEGISGPVVVGVVRPVVVVPVGGNLGDVDAMLAHELAHVVRGDTRWAVLTMAARTLFWFHPLVWVAERELGMCQESACDMTAMAVVGARAPEYGRMLLDVVAASLPGRQRVLGVGVVSTYSSLHRRISAMRHFKVWSVRRRVVVGFTIGLIGVGAVVPWRLTAQEVKEGQAVKKEAGSAKDERPASQPADEKALSYWIAKGRGEKLTLPGVVMTRSAVVRASSEGMVANVMCKPGDSVKKGQDLARFDTSVAEAGLMQAKATMDKDQAILARDQAAARAATVSGSEVEAAKANLAFDRAQLVLKEHELSSLLVKAPMDGVVSEMKVHEGEFVSKGAELMTVVVVKNPRVEVWAPVQEVSKMKGEEIEFRTRGVEKVFRGKIVFVSPVVDGQSGTVRVEADVEDPDGGLRPGLSGEVAVLVK